jgi:hypothetical protein
MVCPLASLLVCPRDVVPRSGGGSGPTLGTVRGGTRRAHARLAPVHRQLTRFAGDGDGDGLVRFLSSWSPATLASHIFADRRQRQNVG